MVQVDVGPELIKERSASQEIYECLSICP